ncbi:flippase [Heyndrickxia coagulans]|uniref:flippase n=1 Tax=Heyndrickxia coagulans TaxID=1398 RepID=UPI0023E44318|nr:flippase [Heyndrickxia coagulans]
MASVKKNFIYNSAYQILTIILPLITAPYISRVMGPSGVGTYSYTYSIANYFVLLAMLGVNNYGNRSIAMVRDNRAKLSETFWQIYYLQLFLSLIMAVLYIGFISLFDVNNFLIYILQFIYVISVAFDINWFCFGLEKFKLSVTRNTIIRLLITSAIFIFVKTNNDLWIYTLLMSLGTLVSQLVIWPFVLKNVDFVKPNFSKIKNHIKPNLILFIPVVAVSLYRIMDKIMLGLMSNTAEVGYFANTERVINIPMGLITALGTVMLPRMSNLAVNGAYEKSKDYIEKSMLFVVFLSSALSFGLAGISTIFAPWFFGEKFSEVSNLISYMSPAIIFSSWASVIRTQFLIPNCKDNIYIISVISGAVINILINLFLIPSYGALGAVIGSLFAEATVCFLQTIMVGKELYFIRYFKKSIIFILFGGIMFICIRNLSALVIKPVFTLLIQIFFGAVIYLGLSLVYFFFLKKNKYI